MKERHYLFKCGYPVSMPSVAQMKKLNARILMNKAGMGIIDGGVGEGKTTLAVHLTDIINGFHGFPPMKLEKDDHPQYAMGGVDFLQKLRLCFEEKLPCVIYDEAGDFSKHGALTKFNQMINRTFETYRAFKILVLLCLPCVNSLDKNIFEKGIPRLLFNCYDRTKNYGCFRIYNHYRMNYLKEAMRKAIVKRMAYRHTRPNYLGNFLDLPPTRQVQLDKITIYGKISILRDSEVKVEGLMNMEEIARKLGKSRVWVRQTLKKLNIKPVRVIKNTNYYSEDTIEILQNHIDGTDKD